MSEDAKQFDAKIVELGDKIIALTLKDAVELGEYLKSKGIEPASGGAVMVAGPAAGAAAAAPAEEKNTFDVVLKSVPADKKIGAIKVVRALTNLGLKEAKDLVDGAPKTVKEGASKDEAAKAKKELEDAGATVELK